jgi:hypothetical protein
MTESDAAELSRLLTDMRDQYESRGHGELVDQIDNVLDLVVGWCSPRTRLTVVPTGLEREGWDVPCDLRDPFGGNEAA